MIVLRVDLLPGMTIREAAEEMIDLAKRLSVMITASFNGFHAIAHPKSNAGELVDQYDAWRKEESRKYKLSQAN